MGVSALACRYAIDTATETNEAQLQQVHLTCWKFVNWLQQLATKVRVNVALHIDGFHKMHIGGWIMLAIGTHCLQFDREAKVYRQSFRPFLLSMGKDHESIPQVKLCMMVCRILKPCVAADAVEATLFDCNHQALKKLCAHFSISFDACQFKANVYDRSSGFMAGMHGDSRAAVTCWPHIKGNALSSKIVGVRLQSVCVCLQESSSTRVRTYQRRTYTSRRCCSTQRGCIWHTRRDSRAS